MIKVEKAARVFACTGWCRCFASFENEDALPSFFFIPNNPHLLFGFGNEAKKCTVSMRPIPSKVALLDFKRLIIDLFTVERGNFE
ncbi:hypothetical protein ABZ916_25905 [Streptomyces sp. NPDC046853]|uniref:hypothetical protein n=1 Tax=Streptomyces sp. NPDC046853 TaxID=3154920 RepID=UPI0034058029